MNFIENTMNSQMKKKMEQLGFTDFTTIQKKCIPEIEQGNDIVGQAETGSGKTLAFVLPILNSLRREKGLQVLVLTPTRELCIQVTDVFKEFGNNLGIKTTSIFGGVPIGPQIRDIPTSHVLVATPGRMLDHIQRRTVDFSGTRYLVLDETDKMFEMGFVEDVERIMHALSSNRQTLLFSATISEGVNTLARKYLKNPIFIQTKSCVDTDKLNQVYYDIYSQNEKFSLLVHLLKTTKSGLSIVFCATRNETEMVTKNLKRQGINASGIHGGMDQNKRIKSLDRLKNQYVDVLVATDVAARGLDIKNVTHVYNYDVPKTPKEYIHRIGRTARAGENGDAITLLTKRDHENFRRVQSDSKLNIEVEKYPQFQRIPFFRESFHTTHGQSSMQQHRMPRRY